MASLEWSRCGAPLTESDLTKVEHALGAPLPPQLRAFYAKQNGGRPSKHLFITEQGDERELAHLMAMKARTLPGSPTLEEVHRDVLVGKGLIPKELLPFARGSGGDYFCVDTRTQRIVFYAMDHCDDPARATRAVAGSFDELLDGLMTGEEAEEEADE